MLKVEITSEDHKTFDISERENELLLNEEAFEWDLIEVKPNTFHVIYKHKSFDIEVLEAHYEEKKFSVKVDDKIYEIKAQNKFDLLLKKLGMDNLNVGKILEVKAPMPGLILAVMVKEGQTVGQGDSLMILEAMKMENILKSPTEGKVKSIKVSTKDNVEKNQVLIQFE